MKISQNCLDVIKKWEGFRLEAYLDPAGIPTIGYGTTRYPDGRRVRIGDRISEPEAEAFLKLDVDRTVADLSPLLRGIRLSQNRFDALVSICYNIGVGAFGSSTVLRRMREGDFAGAAEAFLLWNKITKDGRKVESRGLTNRRRDEKALFERTGGGGEPLETADSAQDRVTRIEAHRDGRDNVLVAYAGSEVEEILVLGSDTAELLIETLRAYPNARRFGIAPPGTPVPDGERTVISPAAPDVPPVADAPPYPGELLQRGSRDVAAGGPVAILQTRLKELGYYRSGIDGEFGRITDEAARDFQSDRFGAAAADGKVGPRTWGALWGKKRAVVRTRAAKRGAPSHLRLTRTNVRDPAGCFRLKLDYVLDGRVADSMFAVSGIARRQYFRTGAASRRGSYEPLPEGRWIIRDILWADEPDVYDRKVWPNAGIGPVKIPVDYVPKTGTARDLIQFHIDWNRSTAPGTAGCIGIGSVADFKRLVGWLRESDPRDLYVDWGLGTADGR